MNILKEIKNSVYNVEYYKSLPGGSLGHSVKYLAKLALLVSLLSVIIFSFYIPDFYRTVKDAVSTTVAGYPDDLVVSIKNGVASVNKPEPYLIPIGDESREESLDDEEREYDNIVVIDTTKPFSSPQFEAYSSIAWLTKTELVAIKNSRDSQIQILPLAGISNLEITKSWVTEKEAFILKILPWLVVPIILFVFLGFFLATFIGTLIMLLLYAFVIWLMSKVASRKLSYKDSYILGIHAATLLVILSAFARFLSLPNNFLIKLLILMFVVYINFFKDSPEKPEEVRSETS